MKKVATLLNWLVLLLLIGTFAAILFKGSAFAYNLGTALGLLIIGTPFWLSIRALRKGAQAAGLAISLNYLIAGLMFLLVIYGLISTSGSLAFLPLALLLTIPAILNIFVLKLPELRTPSPNTPADQATYSPFLLAAADGNIEELTRHLAEGAAVDQRGPSGETALMLSARNNRMDCIKLLLINHANPKLRTPKNSSAEDVASSSSSWP